jgi:PAS domain S-box-containing protein
MPETVSHLFESFCDAMPLGVCPVDLQGKIVYWNAAAEAITG